MEIIKLISQSSVLKTIRKMVKQILGMTVLIFLYITIVSLNNDDDSFGFVNTFVTF